MEREPLKESTKICSGCGQPIDMAGDSVIYKQNGHFFHENHFNPRPRWEVIDKDKGIIFARKGDKHMDIIEGIDEYRGIKYRDIIIYDSNFKKDTLVRTKKEPLK